MSVVSAFAPFEFKLLRFSVGLEDAEGVAFRVEKIAMPADAPDGELREGNFTAKADDFPGYFVELPEQTKAFVPCSGGWGRPNARNRLSLYQLVWHHQSIDSLAIPPTGACKFPCCDHYIH